MPDRITLDRKEFESFLADNQALVDNSQKLMKKIDELEKANRQLGDELQAARAKLESVQSNFANSAREADDTVRNARETMTRIMQEADKRLSR
jgi:predicted  nucleic acid-binding Zn-ribbon protein